MLAATLSNGFVVGMGVGIVFFGLVFLVFITWLMGIIFKDHKKEKTAAQATVPVKAEEKIENKQELLAAVSAVVAEELGRDVSAVRILSFKKM